VLRANALLQNGIINLLVLLVFILIKDISLYLEPVEKLEVFQGPHDIVDLLLLV